MRLDGRSEPRTRGEAGRANLGGRRSDPGAGVGQLGVEVLGSAIGLLELAQPLGECSVFVDDGSQVVAVLAAQLLELVASGLDGSERLGVGFDGVGDRADRVGEVVELGQEVAQTDRIVGERRSAVEPDEGLAQQVPDPVVVGQHRERRRRSLLVIDGVGQDLFLFGQALVFVGVLDRRSVEFVDLIAEQVDLTVTGTLVAADAGEHGFDVVQRAPSLLEGRPIDLAERIEGGPLRIDSEE